TTRVLKLAAVFYAAALFLALLPVRAQEPAKLIAASEPALKAGVVVSPPPTRTLSLSTCFERADLHNKEILSAKWNMALSKAGITIAGAIPNPQFQLQEGFGPSFYSEATGQNTMSQWTQQFLTGSKRTKKLDLARATY